MSEHSPEPWSIYEKGGFIEDASGVVVVDGTSFFRDRKGDPRTREAHWPDLERIIACVNACKGISNETLKAAAKGECVVLLGSSRDLLDALKKSVDGELKRVCGECGRIME